MKFIRKIIECLKRQISLDKIELIFMFLLFIGCILVIFLPKYIPLAASIIAIVFIIYALLL